MFGTSWRVGRIAGVEVRVDSSWVVIALLITYSMYLRFSILYKNLSTGAAIGVAILAAVLFFGSVLIHELAHALFSRARGIRVQDITLFLFGGATRPVESPPRRVLIAVVGSPNGLLAALFWAVEVFAHGALPALIGMFGYLAWVHLLLAGPTCRDSRRRSAAALAHMEGHGQLSPGHPDRHPGRPGGGMAAGSWRRGLPPGRESRRRHMVRVHRLVPRPGRPSLLPRAPGPADAARDPGA